MPSLTTVTLNEEYVFRCKRIVLAKSSISSSPSFLDITPALSYYLSFPLSFTHFSSIPSTLRIAAFFPSCASHSIPLLSSSTSYSKYHFISLNHHLHSNTACLHTTTLLFILFIPNPSPSLQKHPTQNQQMSLSPYPSSNTMSNQPTPPEKKNKNNTEEYSYIALHFIVDY